MLVALLALAVAAFGIGTTEYLMMGLLPDVASDLHVSLSDAGGYVSSYAVGVVIGAPLLTAVGMRLRRKTMLLGMMALFTVGNTLCALAPDHASLLAARFIAGLPHGAFFGVGAVVAAELVTRDKRAQAISTMFLGLTVANIVGVPVGTLGGQDLGWRWMFVAIAMVGLIAFAAVFGWVPWRSRPASASLREELLVFRKLRLWLTFAATVFGFAAVFCFYSYIKPALTDLAGYTPAEVTLLLALFGLGMTVGTALGGRLADRASLRTMCWFLGALAGCLTFFLAASRSQVLAAVDVFLIGLTGFATIPGIQTRILDQAQQAPTLGSASIQSTLNVANSLGAYLGGLAIAGGYGLIAPSWVGALLASVGLGIAILSGWADRLRLPGDSWRAHD